MGRKLLIYVCFIFSGCEGLVISSECTVVWSIHLAEISIFYSLLVAQRWTSLVATVFFLIYI